MSNIVKLAGALAAVVLALPYSAPAEAKIVCREGMQLIQGSYLATPYCQDALVAQVARQRGFNVSDHEIRWNPSRKTEICRAIGRDNRISQACIDSFDDGRSGGPRG